MSTNEICYLDNNATTRVAPEVLETMLPFLSEQYGNPSSAYRFGQSVAEDIDRARTNLASLINAEPRELIFTSCGTESNNTAIHSALSTQPGKRHVVTTAVEHSANLKYCQYLEKQGFEVTYLPVNSDGTLEAGLVEQALRPDTALVTVMWANNETGILYPIQEIAALCRSKGVLFHTDAVQALGKVRIDSREVGPDFMSFSAHKIHAPKGVGALYIKRRTRFQSYLVGGGQERNRRGGTENVAGIVAFGKAAELAGEHLNTYPERVRKLRDELETGILTRVPKASVNGAREPRVPNTSNIAFSGVEAEGVLMLLDQAGICASSGSACTTGSLDPSHVLTAMGCDGSRARSSLRFSLSRYSTQQDVRRVLEHLPQIVETLRRHAPVQEAATAEQTA